MNTPVRVGETIEGSRTMRNRPYPVLKCSQALQVYKKTPCHDTRVNVYQNSFHAKQTKFNGQTFVRRQHNPKHNARRGLQRLLSDRARWEP